MAPRAALALDVADTTTFDDFADRLATTLEDTWGVDTLDALVNNAGIGGGAPFEEVTEEQFDRFHDTLFKGPVLPDPAVAPAAGQRRGRSSTPVAPPHFPNGTEAGYSSYAAQKGAMHVVTRYWAKELSPRGIRVNAVAPGSTRTRIADDAFAKMPEAIPAVAATVAPRAHW